MRLTVFNPSKDFEAKDAGKFVNPQSRIRILTQ